ncbi:hypothetical protein KSD_07550 [Ktedonobacter sp. SOSP1-85]|uniref:hypothetical protein n=1 Tax=Ktedonobacter sp. SOSP1-85 TaxID=2778367 RepID=UPI0019162F09|nr:hypothetical protein [Ktedonobacter sp. SOSP1-85]GHO72984.1 hypothetical protein KSD_07550 [Ktedonobacter sp. SOSP1-85]
MYKPVRDLQGQEEPTTSKGKGKKLEARSLSRHNWYEGDEVVLVPRVKGHGIKGKHKSVKTRPIYEAEEAEAEARPRQSNALLIIGAGMAGALLLIWLMVMVVIPLWNGLQTQWHYGDAHVSHYDLGEHHLVGEVYRGFVTVYDIPQGHPDKAHVFLLQSATDNAVVQFETRDANSDGIPDITVGTEGSSIGITLYGYKDGSFSQQPPQEGK